MDPVTAALNTVNSALLLATEIWKAMPAAQQATNADDWGKVTHNVMDFVQSLQAKLNAIGK
jgi:hypothetical protein